MKFSKRCAAGVAVACALLAYAQAQARTELPVTAQAAPPQGGPLVHGMVEGASLGEWTARWWRWAHGQWVAPYLDPDGRFCEVGQAGPVWFLAGTDGSFDPLRECVVPEGKHLLVPVINMIYWQPRGTATPCSELQQGAAVNNDRLASAVVLLDGEPLGDIRLRRVRSEGCFPLEPGDPDSRLAAADGYWLMLAPLPRGRHTLVVSANYRESDTGYGGMRQNFEYVLDVGSEVLLSAR